MCVMVLLFNISDDQVFTFGGNWKIVDIRPSILLYIHIVILICCVLNALSF